MRLLNAVLAIAWKDLRTELRTKETVAAMLVFALLAAVLFNFALDPGAVILPYIFPGMLWLVIFFAGLLGVYRSFFGEVRGRTLIGLMLAPVDRSALYYGKLLANVCFLLLMEAVLTPLFFLFFDYRPAGVGFRPELVGMLTLVLVLGSIGFAAAGTFLAALAASTRAGEALLPVLLFPLLVPVVLGSVEATKGILDPESARSLQLWLKLLGSYDLIFLAVPAVLFEWLLEV